MTADELLNLATVAEQRSWLAQHLSLLDTAQRHTLAEQLKEACISLMRTNAQAALDCADLVRFLAELTGDPADHALGLRLRAMTLSLCFGRFSEALPLYDQALAAYRQLADPLSQALTQVTRIWTVSHIAGYDAAISAGAWAAEVLREEQRWRDLATLHNNLALIHNRFGRFNEALPALETAHAAYVALGAEGAPFLSNNESNRAFVLYVLGRFKESLAAGERALALALSQQQPILVARARQNLGLTHYALGYYNRALQLLDMARQDWLTDKRYQELIQVELSATYCLLQLRRHEDVLARFRRVHDLITRHQLRPETPFSLLNEARALAHLGRYPEALASLDEARQVISLEDSPWDLAQADLSEATIQYLMAAFAQSRRLALQCAVAFGSQGNQPDVAAANLLVARAELAVGALGNAQEHLQVAHAIAAQQEAAGPLFEAQLLLGQLAELRADPVAARESYLAALVELEQMQAQVISEYRPDFLADQDKEALYEALVRLHIAAEEPEQALGIVERAKSRALLQLFAQRLEKAVEARGERERPLVAEVNRLRNQRNILLRQQAQIIDRPRSRPEVAQELRAIESALAAAWHRLLLYDAAYTGDSSLSQVRTISAAPYLAADTLLLEFFDVAGRYVVFLLPGGAPAAATSYHELPATVADVSKLIAGLRLNMKLAGRCAVDRIPHLLPNAQGILQKLYHMLLGPIATRLESNRRLIIVPHGELHYLPFHALHDGERYLVQQHSLSYLPASSFVALCRRPAPSEPRLLALGNSQAGRLPHTIAETQAIALLWPHQLLLEENATVENLRAGAPDCRLIHLATHGEFRQDDALFSGLALADGWLSTLDVFELPLNASLVTLSACETGQHKVGGGDEIMGLTRAFLAAGAASLLISHWAVADQATSDLMRHFYLSLAGGRRKDDALRAAQVWLLSGAGAAEDGGNPAWQPQYAHPYFWAPFYLLGAADEL